MPRLIAFTVLSATAALAGPPAKVDQALLDKGKGAFSVNCAACHGEKGDGTGPAAAALNPKPRNFTTEPFKQGDTPDAVFKTLNTGVPGTPMVAFAHLSEEDRWALAHWVVQLRGGGKPAPPTPAAAPAAKPEGAKKAKK